MQGQDNLAYVNFLFVLELQVLIFCFVRRNIYSNLKIKRKESENSYQESVISLIPGKSFHVPFHVVYIPN